MEEVVSLGALFLEHAKGNFTERALRERKIRILQYMGEHKFTMSKKLFEVLDSELDGIEKKLEEMQDASPQG